MTVRVSLPAQFAELAGGAESLSLRGGTVGAVLRALAELHPSFRGLLWLPDGAPNPVVVLFLNGRLLAHSGAAGTPLRDGDELTLLSAVEGG
jgi:molybdopterin converting factor small subunit